jgi:TolB-like protein
VALIFAWAFEVTPDGLKKEKEVARSKSLTHVAGRKLDFVIIVLLLMAVGYFAYDKFGPYTSELVKGEVEPPGSPKTIAVLPFVNMSDSEANEYFSDGLTEEILSALAQLPQLRVTARTSSFFFKGQNIPIPEIAARLDVAHVVEGSVRRDGDRVRVTAQLIRASDGFHLWAENYDRTLGDVFEVQEEIAVTVAQMLDLVLDDNARLAMRNAGTRDVGAFIAYQKGLEAHAAAHAQVSGVSERLAIANEYFDQALEVAPGLVAARVMKADRAGHIVRDIASGSLAEKYPGEGRDTLAALREEYDLAWQLSPPGNQRDILDLERILFGEDWRMLKSRIENAMQPGRCPQLDWTNEFIAPLGWAAQLIEKSHETLACDPLNIAAIHELPFLFIWAGEFEAALRAVEEAEKKGIRNPRLDDGRYWALLAAGRVNDPMAEGPEPDSSGMPFPPQILREALAGNPGIARQMAENYWSSPDANNWASLWVAAVVGDRKRANEIAAQIDSRPGSPMVFSGIIFTCFCGAPFDLDVTPNYKTRIEEADVPWPPPKRIDYPTKTW